MSWLIHDPLTRFIAQIVVIVVVARLLGRLARKVGQPLVVAEIVAGIVLGPSILGWVAPSVSAALFPADSLETLRTASQLGLVLFVFLVGLELDPVMLRGRVRASLAIALASIAVSFALGAAVAFQLEAFAGPGGPTLDFALFLGAAMSVTAFPVLARLLADHHLLRTRLGALAIACAAVDDLVAWCLLAAVVAFTRAGGLVEALATTGMALVFVTVMLLAVRPVLDRLVDRISAPLTVSHDIVALAVVGMLVSAWITERIGIHLVFGAFVFGAVLPKRDGFARALAEKLEDVVIVVLLPLFFAVSGLRTHADLVSSADHVLACAAIVAVACAGKFGGTALAARAVGLSWREAGALGVLMNTRGLMELIVLNVGYELGVFSATIFSMMVIMVLVTTIATTPLLRRMYPVREAVRDLLASEPRPPTRTATGYRVLTCISHPRVGPGLVTMAAALAGEGTEVIALHLARGDERAVDTGPAADGDEAAEVLDPALARATELGVAARPLSFVSQDPADDIVRVADLRDADLVLLGLHRPVLSNALLGGVVRDVMAHAEGQVAVFVDRGLESAPLRVLVPVLGGDHDRAAVELARRIEQATGARLAVLESAGTVEQVVAQAGAFDLVVAGVPRDDAERLVRDCATSLLLVRGAAGGLARARVER